MEGPRRRKRTESYTPPNESPETAHVVNSSNMIPPKEKRRCEVTSKNSSSVDIDHVVKDLTRLIDDRNASSIRSQILRVLEVGKRDASTQTDSVARNEISTEQTPACAPHENFHIPAVNVLSGIRKRKRSKSGESPVKRTSSKESQSPDIKSPGKTGKVVDISPDDVCCALCFKLASCTDGGYLYGPYKAETEHSLKQVPLKSSGKKKSVSFPFDELYWMHDMCAVWSQGVYLNGATVEGLTRAIQRGRKNFCNGCGSRGATVLCAGRSAIEKCDKVYHYQCAVEQGCLFDEEALKMYCHEHTPQV
jgi:hypothetical protein